MTVLNLDVDSAEEMIILPPGEYEVRLISVEMKTSKKGNEYANVRLESVSEPLTEDIYDTLMLPTEEMRAEDVKNYNRRLLSFRQLYACFGVDPSGGVDLDDLPGLIGWVILGEEEPENYRRKNTVSSYLPQR